MNREEIQDGAGLHFLGKTDAQILRELYGGRTRRSIVLPEERSEHRHNMASQLQQRRCELVAVMR